MASGLPDSKVHGAYMGPTWDRQDPGGPHVGPMILAIWVAVPIMNVIRHVPLISSRNCIEWKQGWNDTPGPWFKTKMSSCQYSKSHCGDKTVVRPSYLHNGISFTGKTVSLYWIGTQYTTDTKAKVCIAKYSDILNVLSIFNTAATDALVLKSCLRNGSHFVSASMC